MNAGARAARSRPSCGWMLIDRPLLAVVHRSRMVQAVPKVIVRVLLIGRVCPAGQVNLRWSIAKAVPQCHLPRACSRRAWCPAGPGLCPPPRGVPRDVCMARLLALPGTST